MLNENVLKNIEARAIMYDEQNSFPYKDFEELKDNDYYKMLVPKEFGGCGALLRDVAREQTKLASYSPSTALAINMHHIIVGLAKHMVKNGNENGEKILKLAGENNLFAFAISEHSNDLVLFGSLTEAEKIKDGYLLNGEKVFVSMSKEADYLLTFAQIKDTDQLVFGIVKNGSNGITVKEDWDALGMRATQSNSVCFKDVLIENENILTVVNRGPSFDPVVFGIFSHFEILLASVYYGLGKRILNKTVEQVKERFSVSNQTTYNNDPLIRYRVASAQIELEGIDMIIDRLSDDLENGVDYGFRWFPMLSTIKNKASEATYEVSNQAMRSLGGRSYSNLNELSKLYRDALAGLFQPSDQESLHNAWANILLGPKE